MLPMYRNLEWVLLYRLSEHGSSMITFQKKVSTDAMTMLIVMDEKGHKFGALNFEQWKPATKCFGTGESMVFTFHNGDECKCWQGSGNNQMY